MFDATELLRRDESRVSLSPIGVNKTAPTRTVAVAVIFGLLGLVAAIVARVVIGAVVPVANSLTISVAIITVGVLGGSIGGVLALRPRKGDSMARRIGLSVGKRTRSKVTTVDGREVHAYLGICRLTRVAQGPTMVYRQAVRVNPTNLDTLANAPSQKNPFKKRR